MGKKGFERHNRRFQANQQASNKFSQKASKTVIFDFMNYDEVKIKPVNKLIAKVIK